MPKQIGQSGRSPLVSAVKAISKLSPSLVLLVLLGLSVLVTQWVMKMGIQNYGTHMAQMFWVLMLTFLAASFFAHFVMPYRMMKHGLLKNTPLMLTHYLNTPVKQDLVVTAPEAWGRLHDSLTEQIIKTPDTKFTHWEVADINDRNKTMTLAMRYVHNPLGRKPHEVFARQLSCNLKLTGKGTRSEVELTFTAHSAMDYRTVYAIVEETKLAVKNATSERIHAS